MINEELIEYFKSTKNQDIDPEEVVQTLIEAGWSEEDVHDSFRSVYENDKDESIHSFLNAKTNTLAIFLFLVGTLSLLFFGFIFSKNDAPPVTVKTDLANEDSISSEIEEYSCDNLSISDLEEVNKHCDANFEHLCFAENVSEPTEYGESHEGVFFHDKEFVYVGCEKLDGADPLTFSVQSHVIAKDKNSVYYINTWHGAVYPLSILDSSSLEILSLYFIKDKNGIYYHSDGGFTKVNGADIDSFEALSKYYGKDDHNVFAVNQNEQVVIISESDIKTFTVVDVESYNDGTYARDIDQWYRFDKEIDDPTLN